MMRKTLSRLHNKTDETLISCLPFFSILSGAKNGTPNAFDDACCSLSACEVVQRGHRADGAVNNSSVIHTTVPSASSSTRGCSRG